MPNYLNSIDQLASTYWPGSRSMAPPQLLLLLLLAPLLVAEAVVDPEEAIGMPGCDTTCGVMKVPYPFGMGPSRCYWPGFKLTCDRTGNTPRLLLGTTAQLHGQQQLQVEELFLAYPFVRVARAGSDRIDGTPYKLWSGKNQLTLTGCNVRATVKNGDVTMASCYSACDTYEDTTAPYLLTRDSLPCSGTHCCQADMIVNRPRHQAHLGYVTSYRVEVTYLGWNRASDEARVPTRVFLAEKGWFERVWLPAEPTPAAEEDDDATILLQQVPIWLQWEIVGGGVEPASRRNNTDYQCPEEAVRRVCKSNHSTCHKGTIGYTCSCVKGFQGNPYVTHGCKGRCHYGDLTDKGNCTCPPGTQGDPYQPGGCTGPVTGGCRHYCGEMFVPYPFGVGQAGHGCYREGFNLTCHDTGDEPARLFLDSSMVTQVLEISTRNNTVRVLDTGVTTHRIPRPTDGTAAEIQGDLDLSIHGHEEEVPYSLSTRNEFILTGCNLMAELSRASDGSIVSVCASFCSYNDTKQDYNVCNGMGCCRTRISPPYNNAMASRFNYRLKWLNKGSAASADGRSRNASILIAEEGWFDPWRVSGNGKLPILLQWEVLRGFSAAPPPPGKSSRCPRQVSESLCQSKNSYCRRGRRGGYTCHCKTGYDGKPDANPYVSKGCSGGHHFSTKEKYITTGLVIGAGVIFSLFIASSVSKKIKDRRAQILKRRFFENNRGQLLQQLIHQRADIAERMIITLEEIQKATNNFDKARELGGGGHGTVYKGILSDLHVVAIKKPKKVVQKEIDEFINEVAILSQINHRNVVKLYGCCLETEVPLLVYEFISNGTLHEHLHTGESRSLSWDDRLRIAVETAKSLAYLHSTASVPIIHRDVKSHNILLDDTLTAKVADFGASRYVPMDRSGVTTMVQGTIGYLDPMYFYTHRLTEKSDVYSFGVVLVELLTRKKPSSYISPEQDGLIAHFATLFAEGNLLQILDPQVVDEGGEDLEAVATLAVTCVKLSGEDRPVMRQVELTLEAVRASNQDVSANTVVEGVEENGIAVNCPQTEESSRKFSMEVEMSLSSRYPR